MVAKGNIDYINFPPEAVSDNVSGSIRWGNVGDASANLKIDLDGKQIRKRLFNPGQFEIHSFAITMSDKETFTFVVQQDDGTDTWMENDRRTITIRLPPTIIPRSNCSINYSEVPSETEFAKQVVDLAEINIPKIKSIHNGRNRDEKINIIIKPILLDSNGNDCPAATSGKSVLLNMHWFKQIADLYKDMNADNGSIIHEIDHAILDAPYDAFKANPWLVEGLADFVRYKLNYPREAKEKGDFKPGRAIPNYIKGGAFKSYQTSAHFLIYLEKERPTAIKELYQALIDNANIDHVFINQFKKSKEEYVKSYEEKYDPKSYDNNSNRTRFNFLNWILSIFRKSSPPR